MVLRSLDNQLLRSNPRFQTVSVHDIPSSEHNSHELIAGGNVCTLLCCRDTGQFIIGLDYETTMLFHSLTRPQTLLSSFESIKPHMRKRIVARLVCDQVLQIEQTDGSFVDGIMAFEALFSDYSISGTERSTHKLDSLSKSAIEYAILFCSSSSVALARRLYSFNSIPRTHYWDTLIGDSNSFSSWMGLTPRATWLKHLRNYYIENGSSEDKTPWIQWVRKGIDPQSDLRYKIYISPTSEQLNEVLPEVAKICCALEVPAFKVGASILGILRPDKLVVYVKDEASLWNLANELLSATENYDPHGVPFTSPIDTNGMLSWAIDPIEELMPRHHGFHWSWRTFIAGRIANSIANGKGIGHDTNIIDFALECLRLDGIEPIGWYKYKEVN